MTPPSSEGGAGQVSLCLSGGGTVGGLYALYYVSKEGVTMYDGAFPRIVSDRLGGIELSEVSGASYSGKVLFSGMADGKQ